MAATAKAGARAAVVAAYRSADTIGLVVDDKACDAVAAACESAATEKEKEAGRALLAEWRERGVVGADAAERRVVDAATRGDAGKTAERPPGKSAVKAGASFASAAGGGRARDARTSAEEGKSSEAPAKEKKGKGKGGPGKGGDAGGAGGGKTKGAGASGGGGGAPKGWGKPATASTTPLVAASAPFTPPPREGGAVRPGVQGGGQRRRGGGGEAERLRPRVRPEDALRGRAGVRPEV